MSATFDFPQYRKYANDRHFFKIISKEEFEEIAIMGSHFSIHHKIAGILPDRNLILDMLVCHESHFIPSSPDEYNSVLQKCRTELKEF